MESTQKSKFLNQSYALFGLKTLGDMSTLLLWLIIDIKCKFIYHWYIISWIEQKLWCNNHYRHGLRMLQMQLWRGLKFQLTDYNSCYELIKMQSYFIDKNIQTKNKSLFISLNSTSLDGTSSHIDHHITRYSTSLYFNLI